MTRYPKDIQDAAMGCAIPLLGMMVVLLAALAGYLGSLVWRAIFGG